MAKKPLPKPTAPIKAAKAAKIVTPIKAAPVAAKAPVAPKPAPAEIVTARIAPPVTAAKTPFATATDFTKSTTTETLETKMEKITATTEEFVSFGQANIEAFVKSSQIWTAGVQDMQKTFAATAQAQMDATMSTLKAMSGVKSVKEALELQSTMARSSVESLVAETGKLTDASMKLAEQAIAPITARVTVAMEKFSKAA